MGFFEVPQGLAWFAFLLVGESPVGKDLGVIGIKVDGLAILRDGPVALALFSVDVAPVAEGFGEIGLQADGVIVVFERAVPLAIEKKGIAPVVENLGVVGIQSDGFAVVGDGPVPLAFLFLLIRDTPPVGMYVLNMFCMRGSRLWGSRLHRACVV